jgi:hypothetical protein
MLRMAWQRHGAGLEELGPSQEKKDKPSTGTHSTPRQFLSINMRMEIHSRAAYAVVAAGGDAKLTNTGPRLQRHSQG